MNYLRNGVPSDMDAEPEPHYDGEPQPDQGVVIEPYRGPLVGPPLDEAGMPPLPELKDTPEQRYIEASPPIVYQQGFDQPAVADVQFSGEDRAVKRGEAGLRLLGITWLLWLPGLLIYAATHMIFPGSYSGAGCAGPLFFIGDFPILLAPAYTIMALVGSVESRKPRRALMLGGWGVLLNLLTWLIIGGLLNYLPFHLNQLFRLSV